MKFLFSIIITSITSFSFAQKGFKYDGKTNIVYDKSTPLFKIMNDTKFKSQVLVKNLSDSLLLFFISKEMHDVVPVTKNNPKGVVFCKVCILMNSKQQSVEVPEKNSLKYYAEMVFKNKLIVENKLDSVAVMNFVSITGNPYSSKYLVYDEKSKTYSTPYRKRTN